MTLVDASDGSLRATGLDRLRAGDCAEFKELVQPCLSTSCRLMELDCSTVRFMDSDGVGTFVNLHKRLSQQDGELCLSERSPIVRPLFRMLHLDELFELTP